MTDAQAALDKVREALAAGPTPGPWSVETVPTSCGVCHKVGPFPGKRPDDPPRHACLYADYPSAGNPADDELMANAAFIAACHPAAIRELLDERDALKVENEKLLALERDMSNALPGVYYMDPPDGGDVPVLEQLRRMAKDAERYRWLRDTGAAFTVRAVGDAGDECSVVAIDRPALGPAAQSQRQAGRGVGPALQEAFRMTRHPLIGRDVLIHWRNRNNDWHSYTLLDYFEGWILIRGRDEDGDPFTGGDIMVPLADVEFIETTERD